MQPNDQEKRKMRVIRYEAGEAASDATTILKTLFDRIVNECGITNLRWSKLVDAYIRRMEVERGEPITNVVETRASINKNFANAEKMTFKNFFKGMIFQRVRRMKITVTLEHASGVVTEHGVWVPIDNAEIGSEIDKDLDYEPRIPMEQEVVEPNFSPKHIGDQRVIPPPELGEYAGKYPPTAAESNLADD